jgi:pimeloyl-ACP methyl ester carboxylesterase
MTENHSRKGLAAVNGAQLYYETAGDGLPLVMLHAGVADSRQWNNEFAFFARQAPNRFRVVRYDLRGYGKSEPVKGEFSHLQDLTALLDHLELSRPLILMGCSMGGGLALDYAYTRPGDVKALVLVGSGPAGLDLNAPAVEKFEAAEKAYSAGDLDLVAEIETQIWFDGMGRTPAQVNPQMRKLAYDMNRNALRLDAKRLGKRLPDTQAPVSQRLKALTMPVLVLLGEHDTPYIHAAAAYLEDKLPVMRKVVIPDAAHLANMDQPVEFRRIVSEFLAQVS